MLSLSFLSVFDVLFAVLMAPFPQATNLVHLNHMHSDGRGWGVGGRKEEKRRERGGGGGGGGAHVLCT